MLEKFHHVCPLRDIGKKRFVDENEHENSEVSIGKYLKIEILILINS